MRKLLFFLLIVLVECACTTTTPAHAQQMPEWYKTGELSGYSRSNYFVGAGQGGSFEEAQSEAQAAIASQLRVTVESTVEVLKSETRANGDIDFREAVNQSTKSSIDETMQGVEVVEQAESRGSYYVFAVLNKAKFFAGLRSELMDLEGQVKKSLERARTDISNGRVYASIRNYSDAYDRTLKLYTKKGFLEGLAPSDYSMSVSISPANVIGEIRRVLSSIELDIVSGNNQEAELGDVLSEPVVFSVNYRGDGGENIPVSEMRVIVRASDNSVVDQLVTNTRGRAELYLKAVPEQGNRGSVRAILDIRALSAGFQDFIRSPEAMVRYEVEERGPVATSLSIETEDGRPIPRLEQNVSRYLVRLGFEVSEDAPLAIEGVVRKTNEQEVSGFSGTQYKVNVDMVLELFATSTGDKISSALFRGSGMSPQSARAALDAAYQRVNIDRRELTELMSGAEAKISD